MKGLTVNSDILTLTTDQAMTSSDVREVNRKTVVAEVLRQQPRASRASVSRATGLTITTVSSAVNDLVGQGFLDEVRGESAGGKPPIELQWNDQAKQILAIDVSESMAAVVDLRGRVLHQLAWPDGHGRGPEAIRRLIARASELAELATQPLLGLGLAIPGLVSGGTVVESIALNWYEEPIVDELERELGLAVRIVNDTQACALGEFWTASTRAESFAVVRIGEGVGAGLVLGGRLFGGSRALLGELGHLVVGGGTEQCKCGNIGCVETYLAEPKIVERLIRTDPTLGSLGADASSAIFDAASSAEKSSPVAGEIDRIGSDLGAAIAPLVGLLNLDQVLISGSVSGLGSPLLDATVEAVAKHSLPSLAKRVRVTYSDRSEVSALIGSAGAVFHSEFGTL